MNIEERKWNYIVELDKKLLKGSVISSEYISELVRNADISYVHGANLSAIITATAAIEGYLRSETMKNKKLQDLINESCLDEKDINLLHNLPKYRNQIVHISDPWDDEYILESYNEFSLNQERIAKEAIRLLRIVIYSEQYI